MMRQIQTQRPLPELVYEALLNAICEGTLAPGERLTQDDVAERLNVSRLPVGQALKQLKTEGFLVEAGRRGLKVAPLNAGFARELYEFRAGVEQVAAGLAAQRAGPKARDMGERIMRKGLAALEAGNVKALILADRDFHCFIYELAGNDLIRQTMSTQWNHVRRLLQTVMDKPRHQEHVWREHQGILQAILAGEADEAERLARQHVEHAFAHVRRATEPRDEVQYPREQVW